MNEEEFTEMVENIRTAELAIGKITYTLTDKQINGRNFSRSLYIIEDIKQGEIITTKNVKSIRPGFGLHPKYLSSILGKTANKNLYRGEPFKLTDIEE